MENNKHFCTCTDLNCKLNPHSTLKGCDPCIKKNLMKREIPSCFTIECFVNFYLNNKEQ